MTVDEAVAAVEATLDTRLHRVDRKRAREDESSYLLLVLQVRPDLTEAGPVTNGPRLVDKRTAEVTRLSVPDAVSLANRMSAIGAAASRRACGE